MKFVHVSDLHFHTNASDNTEVTAALQAITEKLPDHYLIVTGDISDDGHAKQFENARAALEPFSREGRVFIAPGNHDFGAVGNFFSRERAERFDEMLSGPLERGGTFTGDATPVVNVVKDDTDQVMLIALDTNLETDHPFDFACGAVGPDQLAALNTVLHGPTPTNCPTPTMTKLLFFHHHPFVHHNPFVELQDASDLMRTIYAKVDLLLFGHMHASFKRENMNGIRFALGADNLPGKDWVRAISVEGGKIAVTDVRIQGTDD